MIARVFEALARRIRAYVRRRRRYHVVEVAELPDRLRKLTLYAVGEGGHIWEAAMSCPRNACTRQLRMNLVPEARPRWRLTVDAGGAPTLAPSVWRRADCGCHFWLRDGQVHWCR